MPNLMPKTVRERVLGPREKASNPLLDLKNGGPGTRTPKGLLPAVFKTAALPVRSSPPRVEGTRKRLSFALDARPSVYRGVKQRLG